MKTSSAQLIEQLLVVSSINELINHLKSLPDHQKEAKGNYIVNIRLSTPKPAPKPTTNLNDFHPASEEFEPRLPCECENMNNYVIPHSGYTCTKCGKHYHSNITMC